MTYGDGATVSHNVVSDGLPGFANTVVCEAHSLVECESAQPLRRVVGRLLCVFYVDKEWFVWMVGKQVGQYSSSYALSAHVWCHCKVEEPTYVWPIECVGKPKKFLFFEIPEEVDVCMLLKVEQFLPRQPFRFWEGCLVEIFYVVQA